MRVEVNREPGSPEPVRVHVQSSEGHLYRLEPGASTPNWETFERTADGAPEKVLLWSPSGGGVGATVLWSNANC